MLEANRCLRTPGLLLYKNPFPQQSQTVQVFAADKATDAFLKAPPPSSSSNNDDKVGLQVDRQFLVRLCLRNAGVSLMVHAEPKVPVTISVPPGDEVWVATDTPCVVWTV